MQIYSMPGHLIRRLHQISTSVFADRMKSLGTDLTAPQFATLVALRAHPGSDQATLAGLIAHDRPTMGGLVARLVDKRLVSRAPNPSDKRAKIVTLSPQGDALLDQLLPHVAALQSDILPGLTPQEQTAFLDLAKKITASGNDLSRAPLIQLPPQTDALP